MSRRHKPRVAFTNVAPVEPTPLRLHPRAGLLRGSDGTERAYDFTRFHASPVANSLIGAMLATGLTLRLEKAYGRRIVSGVEHLLEAVQTLGGSATTLDVKVAHIEAAVATIHDAWSDSMAYMTARDMLAVAKSLGADAWERDTWMRLQEVRETGRPEWTPREPYTTTEWNSIRDACRAAMDAVLARHEEGRALLASGTDPRGRGAEAWASKANLVWLANELGPLTASVIESTGVSDNWARRARATQRFTLNDVNAYLYPSTEDLLPFMLLFLGETGIPPRYTEELTIACMERPANGRFTIRYVKRRGRYAEKSDRYKDGNIGTPGGIIRRVISLTARLRHFANRDDLWLVRTQASATKKGVAVPLLLSNATVAEPYLEAFGAKCGLPRLQPSRLRKTWIQNNTKRARAQATPFVLDHTPAVHLEHYARMKALVPVHREIVFDAITEAREVALRSTIITSTEDLVQLQANPASLAKRMGCSEGIAQQALSGTLDLWMNACTGFYDSPFAPKGSPCHGAPLGLCLDCPNGLITPHKLPAIYAYLNHIVGQREVQPASVWKDAFGKAYEKIVFGVLMKFSDDVLREARAVAEAESSLIFLGPELRPFDHMVTA